MVAVASFFSIGLAILRGSSNTFSKFLPLLICIAAIPQLIFLPCLALLLPAIRCALVKQERHGLGWDLVEKLV